MIELIFRALLLVQPFFWIAVLEDEKFMDILNDVNAEYWFQIFAFFCISMIVVFDVSVGFYSSYLLILYIGFVWIGTMHIFRQYNYPFKEAMALGFLIAYMNSWFWEGVLHLWAIAENGLNQNQIYQMAHLIPAVYFLLKWEFDVQESAKNLMFGWVASGLIANLKIAWESVLGVSLYASLSFPLNVYLLILNRGICYYFLFNAIIRWGMPKPKLPPELPHYRTRF